MVYVFKKFEKSDPMTVVGDYENLLEKLSPHSEWDENGSDCDNFVAMANSYFSIEQLHLFHDYDDGDPNDGYFEQLRCCKSQFTAYLKKIYT